MYFDKRLHLNRAVPFIVISAAIEIELKEKMNNRQHRADIAIFLIIEFPFNANSNNNIIFQIKKQLSCHIFSCECCDPDICNILNL
jgi:hypothetical protein